jgi:hypothetical protein
MGTKCEMEIYLKKCVILIAITFNTILFIRFYYCSPLSKFFSLNEDFGFKKLLN